MIAHSHPPRRTYVQAVARARSAASPPFRPRGKAPSPSVFCSRRSVCSPPSLGSTRASAASSRPGESRSRRHLVLPPPQGRVSCPLLLLPACDAACSRDDAVENRHPTCYYCGHCPLPCYTCVLLRVPQRGQCGPPRRSFVRGLIDSGWRHSSHSLVAKRGPCCFPPYVQETMGGNYDQ